MTGVCRRNSWNPNCSDDPRNANSDRSFWASCRNNGPSVSAVSGFLDGEDCLCTMKAFQAMGVRIERHERSALEIARIKVALKLTPEQALDRAELLAP